MNSITADHAMSAILKQTTVLSEIRDPSGTVIGFFAPVAIEHAQRYAEAAAHFDPSEIKRRKESNEPLRTTAEVLEHLKPLEKTCPAS